VRFDWQAAEDDVRPFFGEVEEPADLERWRPKTTTDSRTPAEWREVKIANGECPMAGCGGNLDEACFCPQCGNVSLPGRIVLDATVSREDYVETLPGALWPVEEYAPAEVDQS
jgi:hypothetical protein